jgi:leader peptidase (prepilin peptidase)/N-methyltransferase
VVVAAAIAFLGGLLAGSFVTVVAHRVPRGESIVGPRSRCPGCDTQIAAYDNVPVVSWLMLRGRARCCRAAISPRYPLTELGLGALYAATVLVLWGDGGEVALGLVFVTMLTAVTLTDLERRIIPNRVVLPATVVVLALQLAWKPSIEWPLAGLGGALFLFVAALVYPAGMGMGDVKLALLIGVAVGWTVPLAIFAGTVAGLVPSVVLFARHGTAARKMYIPFGPFLAIGGLVGLFWGHAIADWYLGRM